MSELTTGFILGQITEGYFDSVGRTADAGMAALRGSRRELTQADVDALLAENQALRNDNAHLRAVNASVEEYVKYLEGWGDRLYAELVEIKGR